MKKFNISKCLFNILPFFKSFSKFLKQKGFDHWFDMVFNRNNPPPVEGMSPEGTNRKKIFNQKRKASVVVLRSTAA